MYVHRKLRPARLFCIELFTRDIYHQSSLVANGKDIIIQILKFFHGHVFKKMHK